MFFYNYLRLIEAKEYFKDRDLNPDYAVCLKYIIDLLEKEYKKTQDYSIAMKNVDEFLKEQYKKDEKYMNILLKIKKYNIDNIFYMK